MTPPKTDPLPFIPAGIIWDGETEYQNTLPPGVNRLSPAHVRGQNPAFQRTYPCGLTNAAVARGKQAAGWEQIGISFQNPGRFFDIGFLGYDGVLSFEAVNQWFLLNQFREHASRFAHQLDDALGHHSLASSSEEDRMVTFQTLSSMIGSGWMRYKIWAGTDPEELIIGGNFDGTPLWKRQEPEYVEIDELMCGQCKIATFARRFRFQANLPLFRRLYRSGIIYVANRETTPWEAIIFDVATNPVSTFYDQLEVEYHQALLYYDEIVGAAG